MSYAYRLNEDVRHQPQGPQGRAATDPPLIYTIVQLMPIEADGRLILDTASRASRRISSESLRKISFRILGDLARLMTVGA
jgi:hypothetical protein